jgi:diguanylate cyclase (GGDEF)-like protein
LKSNLRDLEECSTVLNDCAPKTGCPITAVDVKIPPYLLQILQSCRTLPSIPGVVMEILDLAEDPDIGTAKIAKVIARDPALVAKTLKVGNSAWCGARREVTTLGQAVNLIGINATMSLALSFSLVHGLRKKTEPAFNHHAYWRRSVIAAIATRSTGACIKAANQDELFLSGLLQDIGMLVLNEAMPTYGRLVASAQNNHDLLVEIERKELLTDHARVSSWFLQKWGLPGRMISAVGASHETESIRDLLDKSVAIGSRIAEIWVNPNTAAATAGALQAGQLLLDLSSAQFQQILTETAAQLPEITRNLDIPVGEESLVYGLLDQARQAIAELNVRALHEARTLAIQAQRDPLTSLYNRAYLNQLLGVQFDLSRKMGQPLTLIFIDIDHFKKINDTYGHDGGDCVLVSVAQVIQSATRESDTIVRYGGDEFVVLLTSTGEENGAKIAERIRSKTEAQLHVLGDGNRIPVTVSIGWATMSSKLNVLSADELLKVADRSLYLAKTGGRNRVVGAV